MWTRVNFLSNKTLFWLKNLHFWPVAVYVGHSIPKFHANILLTFISYPTLKNEHCLVDIGRTQKFKFHFPVLLYSSSLDIKILYWRQFLCEFSSNKNASSVEAKKYINKKIKYYVGFFEIFFLRVLPVLSLRSLHTAGMGGGGGNGLENLSC